MYGVARDGNLARVVGGTRNSGGGIIWTSDGSGDCCDHRFMRNRCSNLIRRRPNDRQRLEVDDGSEWEVSPFGVT